jgi:Doubled CXXCH motif (Paired_CXXCH_1)/Cytochrome c554 and c-prime
MNSRSGQWAAVGAVLVLALLALAGDVFWNNDSPKSTADVVSPEPEMTVLPPPDVPASPYLNTSSAASYVGSDQCVRCHQDQSDSFAESRHHRSMSLPKALDLPNAEITHQPSGYAYETSTHDNQLVHSESIVRGSTTVPTRETMVKWIMGSGRFGHSFLLEADGFLMQSPLTWYSTRDCWDMSPGYDHANQMSFRRAVSARCLFCHAGVFDVEDDNEYHVTVTEPAIGCERCHGPGSMHVAWHDGTTPDLFADAGSPLPDDVHGDFSIVNPARLDRQLRESVCQQCHLQGDVSVIVRGQEFDSWRPGLPLSSFRQEYRMSSSGDMTIVGHVEQMQHSLCYTQSETLSCTTCHDPHINLTGAALDDKYRNACLTCHQEQQCTEDGALRHDAGNRCVQCHMPSASTEIPHVAFTHHRIGIHTPDASQPPEELASSASGGLQKLVALQPDLESSVDDDRCRGLAWVELYLSDPAASTPETLPKAQQLLQRAWDGGARDAAVAAGLTRIAAELGWDAEIDYWGERVLELDASPSEERMAALASLGDVRFRRGKYEEALVCFTELTQQRRDTRFWFYRGLCEQNLGQTEAALESLKQALACNPGFEGSHAVLAALYDVLGDDELKAEHQRMVELLSRLPLPSP